MSDLRKSKPENNFLKEVCVVAIPVALQCMLQSSFSIVDQIMIGQLGRINIAAIGLAGKFSSIFSVVVAAVGAVTGIMISQYIGSGQRDEADKSLALNLLIAALIALFFSMVCFLVPDKIMRIYSTDEQTIRVAANYLRIVAISFIPIAGTTCISTMLRCMEKAGIPLLATIIAAVFNTGLNYLLIFGKCGFSRMEVTGAAIATVIAGCINFILILSGFFYIYRLKKRKFHFSVHLEKMSGKQYIFILFPILITEFLWSLGENVYAAIYGHLGTDNCAAMTLTNPIQGLMIGALSGLAQAAGILIGKLLGSKDYDKAYQQSKRLVAYGLAGSIVLSILLIILKPFYVDIYQVSDEVKAVAEQLLFVFAIVSPVKVLNMILGGGILRSGGKTRIIMVIDIIGTWGFGVPLGCLSAFVFELPIAYVYFILSLEEVVRLVISFVVFRKRKWMQSL